MEIMDLSSIKNESLFHLKNHISCQNKINKENNDINNLKLYKYSENGESFNNYSENEIIYTPLNKITKFLQDFKILIKIISKEEINYPHNSKRKLLRFIIMDENGNKMKLEAFDKIVDKFKDKIEENNIYEITNVEVGLSDINDNRTYSEYNLILKDNSKFIKKSIFEKKFCEKKDEFKTLNQIKSLNINELVNTLCIVEDKGEIFSKKTKLGSMFIKEIIIFDQSDKMKLTLWSNFTFLNINIGDLLICKKLRVKDFKGKYLNSINETEIFINPSISDFPNIYEKIQNLQKFLEINKLNKGTIKYDYNNSIHTYNFNNNFINNKIFFYNIVYIESILDKIDNYEIKESASLIPYYKIRATITHLEHTEKNFYQGCPNQECSRKVLYSNGYYICQYCRKFYQNPKYYYSLNIKVKDCSGEYWIDVFGKPAELIMAMNAKEYRNLYIKKDIIKMHQINESLEYQQFYFLLKINFKKFNNVNKVNLKAVKIEKFNKKEDTERLLNDIKFKLNIL